MLPDSTDQTALASRDQLAIIFQGVADGIMVQDASGRLVYANAAAARMTGCDSVDELLHIPMQELYSKFDLLGESGEPFPQERLPGRRALHGERNPEVLIRFRNRANGEERWGLVTSSVVSDDQDRARLVVSIFHDVTERQRTEHQIKASLREKEVLLKEIHHRVKNNLQVVSSLLSLQASVEPNLAPLFTESQHRIRAMALVHEKLYKTKSFSALDLGDYIHSLVESLRESYSVSDQVQVEVQAESVGLEIDKAIPCGLIVNELVANALEHAFPKGRAGMVRVSLRQEKDGVLILNISDDGMGLHESIDPQQMETLGLRLVGMLVEQIEGELVITRGTGTAFQITFKSALQPPAKRRAR